MPTPQETITLSQERGETRFFDESGAGLLFAIDDPLGENRRWLKLEDLPPYLISAALMAEDLDISSGADAFEPAHALLQIWRYIMGLPLMPERGISAALARDTLLPLALASGLDASLLEIVLVAEGKRNYAREELLEWRLNSAYYGGGAFGIEAAAQVYLGKSAARLSLAESALLAALVNAPALNPIEAPLHARERGADLLFRMLDAKLLNQAQFDAASGAEVEIRKAGARQAAIAPAFIDYARKQAEAILRGRGYDGARLMARGALRIVTSLDLSLQLQADCLLRAHLAPARPVTTLDGSPCAAAATLSAAPIDIAARPVTGALALIEVGSGKILAMAGDALAISHQPAAALQPFVYMEAFLRREFTPASMVYDLPHSFPGQSDELIYSPANPDGSYRGPLNLRDAMAGGLLPPAAQVADTVGIDAVIRTAQALGFNSLEASKSGLDLLERGGAVSVIDAAYAYKVFASMGVMRGLPVAPIEAGFRGRDPVAILKIEDADGRVLWSYDQGRLEHESVIIEPSAAFMVNDILADADARNANQAGEASNLSWTRRAALVDGFSADQRDSWAIGYTPDLALAVHTSHADGATQSLDIDERAGAAPVWRALMDFAHEQHQLPRRAWEMPADIEEFLVCEISGLLPATTAHCPTRRELVPAGTVLGRDHYWQTFEIDRANGQLATVNTPDQRRQSVAFFLPPDEIMDWWTDNDKPLPPSSYSTDSGSPSARPVRLTSPADFAYAGSIVAVAADINRAGAASSGNWNMALK